MLQQQVQLLTVTADQEGQRLDNFLSSRLKGVPKAALYRIIRTGQIRVNKGRIKPDYRVRSGDVVRLPPMIVSDTQVPARPSAPVIELLREAVLYHKDGLLIVNKPSGMAVHGGSGISLGLIEALRQTGDYPGFLELVHRLDRDTSGCVMVARKRSVLKYFQEALRQRQFVEKRYLALVQGDWPAGCTSVDEPLKRFVLANGERVVRVRADGKAARTEFKVIQRYEQATLVEARPITGRTHQIRVHAKHVGCPLVGDLKYGDTALCQKLSASGFQRLFLHAASLSLKLPSGDNLRVEAALPSALSLPLAALSSR